jgi:AcrR family transcriptional regulator
MENAKRGRPTKESSTLDATIILRCAKELMKDTGKPPSIRTLASALNVDPMAIYHYYENKSALLEAIAKSLMEKIASPKGSDCWQENIRSLSLSYIKLLQEYHGLLETFLSMENGGPAYIFSERFSNIVQELNLTPEVEKDAIDLLADYLHGYTLAMSCNNSTSMKNPLPIIEGPLRLICTSLERHAR